MDTSQQEQAAGPGGPTVPTAATAITTTTNIDPLSVREPGPEHRWIETDEAMLKILFFG